MRWLAIVLVGCAGSGAVERGDRARAAGRAAEAAAEYEACVGEGGPLACYVRLAELARPGGAAPSCRRFQRALDGARARFGDDEQWNGPHAREWLPEPALRYPNVASLADWFDRVADACRARDEDRADIRDDRKRRVFADACVRDRARPVEALDAEATAAACDRLRAEAPSLIGVDRETDRAIADGLVLGALTALDDRFVAACAAAALRPVCPSEAELHRRMWARLRALATTGPPAARIAWARHYLKRWPAGPDVAAMRAARERAELDLALAAPAEERAARLDQFLADWPESPLRDEALAAQAKMRVK